MIVLHFDYPSAAATVALLRLQPLADEGADVDFHGVDVLGLDRAVPATLDQLEEHERYRERAAALGLELRRPRLRPPTLPAHLAGRVADERGLGGAWRRRCLEAYWRDGADLGDEALLVGLARDVGLDGGEVHRRLADPAARAAVRRSMVEARRRGVGGVPVLEVGGALVPADLPDEDLRTLAGLR